MKFNIFDYQLTNDINRQYSPDFIRAGLVFGLIIYSVFGALDFFLLPENYPIAWIIRFGIMTPFLLLFYALTYNEKLLPLFGTIMPVLVVFGQIGIIAMIYFAEPTEGAYFVYYAGLILVSLWAGFIYRLQIGAVIFISVISIILYNLVAIFDQKLLDNAYNSYEVGIYLNNNFFLFSTSLLAAIGAFQMNKYHKTIIIKNNELTKERDDLEIARHKAEQSDKLKTAFLSNISHEIRTPMNAILGFSQILNDDDISKEESKEFANLILEKGGDLMKLINDLLDYSKLMAYDIKLNFTHFNILEVVEEILLYGNSLLLKKDPDTNRVVKFEETTSDVILFSDRHRVVQILEHIVHNAVKFSSKKDIEIGFYTENENDKAFIVCYVKDFGIGISAEQEKLIFDSFRQADESFSRRYDGTGIGLSFSKPMATMLGGKVWFNSVVGQGSTFFLSIPLPEEE